jgi:hypothetical protein
MMIRVMYNDGNFDIVKPDLLDMLIEQQSITSFKRSEGWIVLGRDPTRKTRHQDYTGPERRQHSFSYGLSPA